MNWFRKFLVKLKGEHLSDFDLELKDRVTELDRRAGALRDRAMMDGEDGPYPWLVRQKKLRTNEGINK